MGGLSSARRRHPRHINGMSASVLPDLTPLTESCNANITSSNFESTTREQDSELPKKRKNASRHKSLMIWLKQESKFLSLGSGFILFMYILVAGCNSIFQKSAHIFKQIKYNGRSTWVRSHILSYYDYHSGTYIKRSINVELPKPLKQYLPPKWKSIEQEPWFDFQDPDDGVAFSLQDDDSNNQQFFPMAEWQTSNYQNCNQFHELETHSSHSLLMQYINIVVPSCLIMDKIHWSSKLSN